MNRWNGKRNHSKLLSFDFFREQSRHFDSNVTHWILFSLRIRTLKCRHWNLENEFWNGKISKLLIFLCHFEWSNGISFRALYENFDFNSKKKKEIWKPTEKLVRNENSSIFLYRTVSIFRCFFLWCHILH